MRCLFLNMKIVHFFSATALIMNAIIWFENTISIVIQLVLAFVILLRAIDQKRWVVNTIKELELCLSYLSDDLPSNARKRQLRSFLVLKDIVHLVAATALIINAITFSENAIGIVIQLVLVFAVLLHDIDQKRWVLNTVKELELCLSSLSEKDTSKIGDENKDFNAEIAELWGFVDQFRLRMREILKQISDPAENATKNRISHFESEVFELSRQVLEASKNVEFMTRDMEPAPQIEKCPR